MSATRQPASQVSTDSAPARQSRSQKTKAVLVKAARAVFEQDGYFDARIDDIVTESEVARGTFYTYFKSKAEILEVILDEVSERLSEGSRVPLDTLLADPLNCVRQFISQYLQVYETNARILEIVTQVATVDPAVRARRLRDRREHVENIAHAIRLWQYNGIADKNLDPQITAEALASMLTNFAYWSVIGGDPRDRERAIDALTAVWANAFCIPKNAREIIAQRRADGHSGPQIGVTSESQNADSKPLARRGYWK